MKSFDGRLESQRRLNKFLDQMVHFDGGDADLGKRAHKYILVETVMY